jgi:hypothetical protein
MARPQITKIELQGFRSFGHARQIIEVPDTVSVLWGSNSQGKTSFAEAIEFLLTGQIVRRDLMASAKDEFTEALRNVHLAAQHAVVVTAHVRCHDGAVRRMTRTLVDDYKRGAAAGCVSRLDIDGVSCHESKIEQLLGIKLSQPPLRAPVLAQHTLAYIFSVTPSERASYFRALLDTQDLEEFRAFVAALSGLLKLPTLPPMDDLRALEAIDEFQSAAAALGKCRTEADLGARLLQTTSSLLAHLGIKPEVTIQGQSKQIDDELQRRRSVTFPLGMFARAALVPWERPSTQLLSHIQAFIVERGKIDLETQKLVGLFTAALALPAHPTDHDPIDCPLCGAERTLTTGRIAYIREQLAASASFLEAAKGFRIAMQAIDTLIDTLIQGVTKAQPAFMRELAVKRRAAGFTVQSITKLGTEPETLRYWLDAMRPLWRTSVRLKAVAQEARDVVGRALRDEDTWKDIDGLNAVIEAVDLAYSETVSCLRDYQNPARELGETLKLTVDQSIDIKGWDALSRLALDAHGLWHALTTARQHDIEVKSLTKALNEIEAATGRVNDQKFGDLSDDVRHWWNKLRPDEPTFFDTVARRSAKSCRTIDLRVGLSAHADRSDPKIRDAVAVFSQSQLHCLGLSLFLARAVQEGAGFVVLDDPVLTSDDDYRPNFTSSVIEALLELGIQIVICTQDHKSWKEIGDRWQHRGAIQFQIIRHDPALGTEIRSQNDDLATMIAKAQPYVVSQDPINRKEGGVQVRAAIERFCKMLIVRDRIRNGDVLAAITEYDGQNFGTYKNSALSLLTKDRSHPGKVNSAYNYATPAPHDDKPPSSGELKMALGDLRMLKKAYLDG